MVDSRVMWFIQSRMSLTIAPEGTGYNLRESDKFYIKDFPPTYYITFPSSFAKQSEETWTNCHPKCSSANQERETTFKAK